MSRRTIVTIGGILLILLLIVMNWAIIMTYLTIGIVCVSFCGFLGYLGYIVLKWLYLEFFGPEELERRRELKAKRKLEAEQYHRNTFEKQQTWK